MTVVEATLRRSLNYSSFADITDVPLLHWNKTRAEFDGDLTDIQIQAVWARMESADDTDQARRAALRTDRAALEADDPLRRLYDYTLGE